MLTSMAHVQEQILFSLAQLQFVAPTALSSSSSSLRIISGDLTSLSSADSAKQHAVNDEGLVLHQSFLEAWHVVQTRHVTLLYQWVEECLLLNVPHEKTKMDHSIIAATNSTLRQCREDVVACSERLMPLPQSSGLPPRPFDDGNWIDTSTSFGFSEKCTYNYGSNQVKMTPPLLPTVKGGVGVGFGFAESTMASSSSSSIWLPPAPLVATEHSVQTFCARLHHDVLAQR